MNDSGKFLGRKFLLEYHVASLNVDSLQEILSKQGYTVIEFNHLQNTAAVEQLLKALHLTETAARLKGFTYADINFRLVFVHEGLSEKEKLNVLAHEEGHIYCGHLSHAPIIGQDISEEVEANEFASYVLKPHNDLKIKLWMQANKGKACLLALVLMLLIIGGCQFIKTKADKAYWSNYYITATGTKYHRENCMFVKGKKSVKQLTWDEVRSGQYEPCQICLPQD
mgnify:CR=1 FL=1